MPPWLPSSSPSSTHAFASGLASSKQGMWRRKIGVGSIKKGVGRVKGMGGVRRKGY